MNKFEPQIELSHAERGSLVALSTTEGYQVMHRIFRSEVDKFIVELINAPVESADTIYRRHTLAKAAAQFYTQITEKINEEIFHYKSAMRNSDTPVDPTNNMLDFGGIETDATGRLNLNQAFLEEGMDHDEF